MNISEMHVWFRQYAQQMGMQNVRAILPEQIDLLINTSIIDTVNQVIKENIGTTNDRVITDNSKIGQINALRSLYTVQEIPCFEQKHISKYDADNEEIIKKYNPIKLNKSDYSSTATSEENTIVGKYYCFMEEDKYPYVYKCITSCEISANGSSSLHAVLSNNGPMKFNEAFIDDSETAFTLDKSEAHIGRITGHELLSNYMYLVDFSINYKSANKGIGDVPPIFTDNYKSKFFPVRLIDDAYLADTLNDFVLKNRLRSPILTIYNDTNKNLYFDLYIDEFTKHSDNTYYLVNNLVPYNLRISYIAKPAEVKYAVDLNGKNIDCDLPESMHIDILKHAVDLYRISVTGSLSSAQQAEQNQQREALRNNYRNDNTQQQQ